jgi:hypothetical protein
MDLLKALLSNGSMNTQQPNVQQYDDCYNLLLGNSYEKSEKPQQ